MHDREIRGYTIRNRQSSKGRGTKLDVTSRLPSGYSTLLRDLHFFSHVRAEMRAIVNFSALNAATTVTGDRHYGTTAFH